MKHKLEGIVFLVIILVASFFRLYKLNSIPPGLWPDVAMNGNNAIQANQAGDYQVFYPENNGREGLFINIQALSIKVFGNTTYALKFPAAIAGILTIMGLYLLTRRLFNWQIAALSSFLMAISFWHVLFSRIGFRAIMAPLFLIWGLYFFWRGLSEVNLHDFLISGIFWGLGFHTYIAFRVMPLVIFFTLLAYWHGVKKDFRHIKYFYVRLKVFQGIILLIFSFVILVAPLAYYFYTHMDQFWGRTGQVSIFSSGHPLAFLVVNVFKTLGMFTFVGDFNWRHNFAGEPLLFWPIGAVFMVGLIRSFMKLKTKHGHSSSVQVMLLSWFFVGLLPVIFSNEGLPHALRSIIVAPVVFIFAGEGLWWVFENMQRWYTTRDMHRLEVPVPRHHHWSMLEGTFVSVLVLVIFLAAISIAEFDKYFNQWATNPNVAVAYTADHVKLADRLNLLPKSLLKYVVVTNNDLSIWPQTVMYLTDTWTKEKQKAKNLYYITNDQYRQGQYNHKGMILFLN